MKRKSIILITLLILMFTVLSFSLIGCKKVDIVVSSDNLNVFMGQGDVNTAGEFYIGTKTFKGDGIEITNTLDLSKAIGPEYTYSLVKNDGEVALAGSLLTIYGSDKGNDYFEVLVKGAKVPLWYRFHIVDGAYNVFTYQEFATVVTEDVKSLAGPACLFADIDMVKANTITLLDDTVLPTEGLNVLNDIYGNGHVINAHEVVKANWDKKDWGGPALDLSYADDVRVQDFKITGKIIEGDFTLTDLNAYGALIESTSSNPNVHPNIVIRNVIAENSHKVIFLRNCDAVIDGCIIRNASDSTISIETHPAGGANITIKNSTIANSLTGGIVMWGYTEVKGTEPEKYVNLKLEGFVDIFNWKNDQETKLMPDTEAASKLVDPLIKDSLNNKKYQQYFYKHDGIRYLHLGIIMLATGGLKENRAVVNGKLLVESAGQKIDGTDYMIKDFPLPSAADMFCKSCLFIGYDSNDTSIRITPDTKFEDNPNFYQDMYWGRKE